MASTASLPADYGPLLDAVRLVVRQELTAYPVNGRPLPPAPSEAGQSEEADQALTARQTARLLGVCTPTVYALMHRGALPAHKQARRYFWKKSEVLAYLRAQVTPKRARRAARQLALHS